MSEVGINCGMDGHAWSFQVWKLTVKYDYSITDLLTIEHHTPTPEPVKYDKKDGQWYTHDGVDVKDTQQRRGWFHCTWPVY